MIAPTLSAFQTYDLLATQKVVVQLLDDRLLDDMRYHQPIIMKRVDQIKTIVTEFFRLYKALEIVLSRYLSEVKIPSECKDIKNVELFYYLSRYFILSEYFVEKGIDEIWLAPTRHRFDLNHCERHFYQALSKNGKENPMFSKMRKNNEAFASALEVGSRGLEGKEKCIEVERIIESFYGE